MFTFPYIGKFHSVWDSCPIIFVLCNIQNTLRLCVCFLATESINKACLWTFVPSLSSVVFWHSTPDLWLLSEIPVAKRVREKGRSPKNIFKRQHPPAFWIKTGLGCFFFHSFEWKKKNIWMKKGNKKKKGKQLSYQPTVLVYQQLHFHSYKLTVQQTVVISHQAVQTSLLYLFRQD